MIERDARFYFLNLGSDITRCIIAAEKAEETEYQNSLMRAKRTLNHLREAQRPEAYEEGLLLMRALFFAHENRTLSAFRQKLNALMAPFAAPIFV